MPEHTENKINTYHAVRVYEPNKFETTTYLVQQDEKGIFKDLLTIQQDTLNSAINKEVEKKWEILHYDISGNERSRIKRLPWYKRLFNKF